jgi:hypothetical protein
LTDTKHKQKLKDIIRNLEYACGEMQLLKGEISYDVFTQANDIEGFDMEIIETFNSHINNLSDAVTYLKCSF